MYLNMTAYVIKTDQHTNFIQRKVLFCNQVVTFMAVKSLLVVHLKKITNNTVATNTTKI